MSVEESKTLPTKEKAIEILIDKLKLEYETEQKLAHFKVQCQAEAQKLMIVERTKIQDQLYLKH